MIFHGYVKLPQGMCYLRRKISLSLEEQSVKNCSPCGASLYSKDGQDWSSHINTGSNDTYMFVSTGSEALTNLACNVERKISVFSAVNQVLNSISAIHYHTVSKSIQIQQCNHIYVSGCVGKKNTTRNCQTRRENDEFYLRIVGSLKMFRQPI